MPAVSNACDRLHERVRRWVWREKWDQLRDVQELAVDPILSGSRDVIILMIADNLSVISRQDYPGRLKKV